MASRPAPGSSIELDARSNRPLVVGTVTLCVIGTLGAVANASAPSARGGRGPGVADVFRLNPTVITIWSGLAMALATLIALLAFRWSVRRSWPWLILAGVLLTLPSEYLNLTTTPYRAFGSDSVGPWVMTALPAGAAQLVLLGVLGAGMWLVRVESSRHAGPSHDPDRGEHGRPSLRSEPSDYGVPVQRRVRPTALAK